MTNQIEPYSMIQKTNIKEHNDMVNKINEIVDVINNTNLDTINAEISGLKAKATATDTEIANIKNKDTTQDTEIDGISKSLVSNVTATFDNPRRELKISLGREASPSIDTTVVIPASSETGQYSAGNGITINNYQIAVDTGVVALKSDIPVVPDINQLTADVEQNTTDIQTINTEITGITNKNTEQDTAIAGKVAISQGVENAGKVLGIGADGNVTPVNAGGSSGGEVWEELDLVNRNNWPTDWSVGDRVRIFFKVVPSVNSPFVVASQWVNQLVELTITSTTEPWQNSIVLNYDISQNFCVLYDVLFQNFKYNTETVNMFRIKGSFNGASGTLLITNDTMSTYIHKMWRCRASQ